MAKAVRYHKQGGPEVLQVDDVQVGDPGQGQVRIKHTAIGVNFVDTYQRSGLYPMQLPAVAGNEGAGVVEAVGAGVTDLKAGDRITYTGIPGSYCEQRLVPADSPRGSRTRSCCSSCQRRRGSAVLCRPRTSRLQPRHGCQCAHHVGSPRRRRRIPSRTSLLE